MGAAPLPGSGAAVAQQPPGTEPGEIIIKRKVPYRPAARQRAPFHPNTVQTSPEPQVLRASAGVIKTLTDEQAALLSTGNALAAPDGLLQTNLNAAVDATAVLRPGSQPLTGALGRSLGTGGPMMRSLSGIGTTVSNAVGRATSPRTGGVR